MWRRNMWWRWARVGACCVAARVALPQAPAVGDRPRIGVAFGGGSARGLAHVGVIRWFEEHHIPIDLVAGTSMGGLVGGAYAAGMSAGELSTLLAGTDWDEMFGASSFRYKNVARKRDARAFPTRLEFGFHHGIVPPHALNNGQEVDYLLARIAGAYPSLATFDALPTPFRCVAIDLVSARPVVLDRGSLARAMRATMSLPGVFPPVRFDGRILVDGGAMDNVPTDVVRAMGANVVIAVPVGDISDTQSINYSLYAIADETVDATMRLNTRTALRSADVVINPARNFGALDWRRSDALEADGYAAAEAMKTKLLPLAVNADQWSQYQAERRARRRIGLPSPSFVRVVGATASDRERMEHDLRRYVGARLDVRELEQTLAKFSGLDRYEVVDWQLVREGNAFGLEITARPKGYAPPFFMFGVNVANTTSELFTLQLAARYLAFDVGGADTEFRVDGAIGADPHVGAEWYRPFGNSPFFIAPSVSLSREGFDFVEDDAVVGQYETRRYGGMLEVGVNATRIDELRLGMRAEHLRTSLHAGDPRLPDLDGVETGAALHWTHDGQDSPVIPSAGTHAIGALSYVIASPSIGSDFSTTRTNDHLAQLAIDANRFWPRGNGDR
ncbi:MAG TPA: patatin-like phospholipase family protein, partial [Gemmatimonadaceae bacterium]